MTRGSVKEYVDAVGESYKRASPGRAQPRDRVPQEGGHALVEVQPCQVSWETEGIPETGSTSGEWNSL